MIKQGYKIEGVYIDKPDQIRRDNLNGISFSNTGTADILINNYLLGSGKSISFSGNYGEVDTTTYNLKQSGLGTMFCYVQLKIYVK